jgi:site-specific recombinase XerD
MNAIAMVSHFASSEENVRFGQFLDWLTARGRSDATARSYRSDWQDLAAWYRRARGTAFDASMLDAETVSAWRQAGESKGKSPATLTRRLAFVRTYGRWLAEDGVVTSEAAANVRVLRRGGAQCPQR